MEHDHGAKPNGQTGWATVIGEPSTQIIAEPTTNTGYISPPSAADWRETSFIPPQEKDSDLPLEDIYTNPEAISLELRNAMSLTPQAVKLAVEANEDLESGDFIASDAAMMKLRLILPELFCCRRLGDGFGAVINALMSSFENRA